MALGQNTINAQAELATHRQRLALLLQQQGKLGAYTPPYVFIDIQEAQTAIRRLKDQLRADNLLVEDEPNDEAQPAIVAAPSRRTPQEQRNRDRMLDKVELFWVKGVLEQSLYQVARIELGFEQAPVQVNHPWETVLYRVHQPNEIIPAGRSILSVFDELLGELLILGAPGAGKTTTLLELARDLIARARENDQHPIPVVFNLSTWAAKRQPLSAWLTDELSQRYDVPKKLAQEWVNTSTVLPLLDGLDEVAAEYREACVAAINDYRKAAGFVPLSICSRIADYDALSTKLRLQGAIVIQPLTKPQVDNYFKRVGRSLASVRAALRDDTTLWELMDNPLMLSIVAFAYKDKPITKLRATVTPQERRWQLFDDYIAAMFHRRGRETRYSPQQTVRWLASLGRQMNEKNVSVFFIERLQPDWLPTSSARWQYSGLIRLIGALIGGLILSLVAPFSIRLLSSLLLLVLLIWLLSGEKSTSATTRWPGERLARAVILTVVTWAVALFLTPFLIGSGFTVAPRVWLATGLIGALAGGLGARPQHIVLVETLRLSKARPLALFSLSKARPLALFSLLAIGVFIGGCGIIAALIIITRCGGWICVLALPERMVAELNEAWPSSRYLIGLELQIGLGSAALAFGIWVVLASVLTRGELEERLNANQGIWRSAQSALAGGLTAGCLYGLVSGLTTTLFRGQLTGAMLGLVWGFVFGLFAALAYGGYACLLHFALRGVLWRSGALPWNVARFLDYSAERIFLRKVGGGYIFVHRLLMEHFASLYNEQAKNTTQT